MNCPATGSGELSIRNLDATICGTRILHDICLNIRNGEVVSLIGPNGAGKSTLLKCVIRLIQYQRGRICVNSHDIELMSQRELARHVAYVPQTHIPDPPFTVNETLLSARYAHFNPLSGPTRQDRKVVCSLMEHLNIDSLSHRMLGTLSGGERQKVMVAAAMAQEPKILLLDELTTFLDPRHQSEIMEMIRNLAISHNVAILSATHELNHAALLSHRIAALKDGRIHWVLPPAQAMTPDRLTEIFEGGIELIGDGYGNIPGIPLAMPASLVLPETRISPAIIREATGEGPESREPGTGKRGAENSESREPGARKRGPESRDF